LTGSWYGEHLTTLHQLNFQVSPLDFLPSFRTAIRTVRYIHQLHHNLNILRLISHCSKIRAVWNCTDQKSIKEDSYVAVKSGLYSQQHAIFGAKTKNAGPLWASGTYTLGQLPYRRHSPVLAEVEPMLRERGPLLQCHDTQSILIGSRADVILPWSM
jgi:hypothetical protein